MRDGLVDRFAALGDRVAIVEADTPFSYGELAAEIARLEETLRASGVRPNEAVVLNGDFSFRAVAALFALFRNRNVIVPVVILTDRTLETVVSACRPTHVVRVRADAEVEALPARPGADPAAPDPPASSTGGSGVGESIAAYQRLADDGAAGLVLLSSGSTGAPKAILHNLDAIMANKLGGRARGAGRPANILMFLLFDHIGGVNSLLGALRVGNTAVVPRCRTPQEICALIGKYRIRLLPTSPTFLNLILIGRYHEKFDLSSLRLITYGTEPMPEELLRRVNEAFPGVRLLQTFGTSETGISTTTSESSRSTWFKIEDSTVEYRVVDGELQLRTTTQFLGYLNYPSDSITADGWFRTGDLVEEGDDGFIRVRGRAKEIINVGGEKVLPLELESILMGSPLIEDCVVYGRANAITGQAVCVDVKPTGEMTRAELRRHVVGFLTGKVEPFKIPAKINVVDAVTVSERFKKRRVVP